MKINVDKPQEMVISFAGKRTEVPAVTTWGSPTEHTRTFMLRQLGVWLSNSLDWGPHVEYLLNKCLQRLYLMVLLKCSGVADQDIHYTSTAHSVLKYACQVWHMSLTKEQSGQLESVR